MQLSSQNGNHNIVNHRAFAGTANARDTYELAQRDVDIDILEIMVPRTLNLNRVRDRSPMVFGIGVGRL